MANTLKFGANEWATKDGSILAYNDENNNFKPLPFTFDRESTATVVGKDGLIKTVGANEPRVDYKDNTDGAMLLEPQSTNLITYSEDFSQWSSNGGGVTSNQTISPDGTLNADKLFAKTNNGQHRIDFSSSNASGATTFSFFAKSAEYNSVWVRIGLSTSYFNLENGESFNNNTDTTSSIKYYGNGWYRCIITKEISSANEVCRINLTQSYKDSSVWIGDGTSGLYIWGAMHEQGSYATSLINTSGSAVTRLRDSCSQLLPNVDSFNSSNGFSLVAEFGSGAAGSGTSSPFMLFNDRDTSSTYIGIGSNSSSFRCRLNIDGTAYLNTLPNAPRTNDENKIFISCDANGWSQGGNGVVAFNGNDNTSVLNSIGLINILTSEVYGVIRIKKIELYNTRLTDQELIELTKI